MRPLVLIALVAAGLAASLPAYSQTVNYEPTVTNVPPPGGAKPATVTRTVAKPEARAHRPGRHSRGGTDCRFCLDLPTDLQVMKCAEKYR
jgi:hypothetical protein